MGRIDKLRRDFGIEEMVFVGDRKMLISSRCDDLGTEEYKRIKYPPNNCSGVTEKGS